MKTISNSIRVVIVDDHPLIHEAVRSLLSKHNDMELVAEGTTGEHVIPLVTKHQPDILLLDLSMPQHAADPETDRFSAPSTLLTLQATHPETAVIILSQYLRPAILQYMIKYGVRGYILKGDNFSLTIPKALQEVSQGGSYFSPKVTRALVSQSHQPNHILTQRQKEIVLTVAQNPDITYAVLASTLYIAESTFKGHLQQVFKILEVGNITACIMRCIDLGLITCDLTDNGLTFPPPPIPLQN